MISIIIISISAFFSISGIAYVTYYHHTLLFTLAWVTFLLL